MPRIFLRLLFSKVFNVFSKVFVLHQLSDQSVRTARRLDLKKFSFIFYKCFGTMIDATKVYTSILVKRP